MDLSGIFVLIFVIHSGSSIDIFENEVPAWSQIKSTEMAILKSYLKKMTQVQSSLSESSWSRVSFLTNGKSVSEARTDKIRFEEENHPNLAKMITFEDNELACEVTNNHTAKHVLVKSGQGLDEWILRSSNNGSKLLCLISGSLKIDDNKINLEANDCIWIKSSKVTMESVVDDFVEVIGIYWPSDDQQQADLQNCPKKPKKNLFDILKLKGDSNELLIHAGDKYLSSSQDLDLTAFVSLLKMDMKMVTPKLPAWDEECQDMGEELFDILDTNGDKKLNDKDIKAARSILETRRLSQLVKNKKNDFDEIGFDMQIKVAGAIDFTLPRLEIESMILSSQDRDQEIWEQAKQGLESSATLKDEL